MYIILGSIFDTVAAMVITLPFVYPLVVDTLGYNAIWWGIMMVMVMEVGMITPPIGINVFVLHAVAKNLTLTQIYRGISPFLIADFARLLLVAAIPALALALARLAGLSAGIRGGALNQGPRAAPSVCGPGVMAIVTRSPGSRQRCPRAVNSRTLASPTRIDIAHARAHEDRWPRPCPES